MAVVVACVTLAPLALYISAPIWGKAISWAIMRLLMR